MARLFQPTYRDRNGNLRTAKRWYVEFRDHHGGPRRLPTFTDRRAAMTFGRNVERLVEQRITGESFDIETRRWLESLPSKMLERLAKIDLIDSKRAASIKSLTDHIADFKESLLESGVTPAYAHKTSTRVTKVVDGIGAQLVSQLKAEDVATQLAKLREGKKGLGARTSNHHLAAVKQFGTWLVKNKRVMENPFTHLTALNSKIDRRHVRRTLEPQELAQLLSATRKGPVFTYWRMTKDESDNTHKVPTEITGEERFWLYKLAAETGLRSNELRQLRRAELDLASAEPTISVTAEVAKNRKAATLPLRPDTATGLKTFVADKHPVAKVFKLPRPENIVVMLRKDLKAADIAYEDELGRVCDFHSSASASLVC